MKLGFTLKIMQGREADAHKVAWQDEALGHIAVRLWGDGRQPVQRPAAAPLGYPPAEIPAFFSFLYF